MHAQRISKRFAHTAVEQVTAQQDLHLLEERVFQDAPCTPLYGESQELSGRGRWPQSTMVLDQYRYTPPSSRSATLIALRGATGMRTSERIVDFSVGAKHYGNRTLRS